jgi:hypothetical protein
MPTASSCLWHGGGDEPWLHDLAALARDSVPATGPRSLKRPSPANLPHIYENIFVPPLSSTIAASTHL